MILLIITILFGVIGINLFAFSTRLTTVDRVVLRTPKELFESSIPLLTNDNTLVPIFDTEKLNQKLTYYYTTNLTKACKSFSFETYYYNKEDMSMCVSEKCTAVEVTVNANIIFNFNYSKTIFYEIRKGSYGN